jgi:hypothetical protein
MSEFLFVTNCDLVLLTAYLQLQSLCPLSQIVSLVARQCLGITHFLKAVRRVSIYYPEFLKGIHALCQSGLLVRKWDPPHPLRKVVLCLLA